MKIMIADDNKGIRDMLKSHLELTIIDPFEIIECESGEEVVKVYTLQQPDCGSWILNCTRRMGLKPHRSSTNKIKTLKLSWLQDTTLHL